MANYLTTDTELTSVANAIRTKGGTNASLTWPNGFVNAISNISTGGGTVENAATVYANNNGTKFILPLTNGSYHEENEDTPSQLYSQLLASGVGLYGMTADSNGNVVWKGYVMHIVDANHADIIEHYFGGGEFYIDAIEEHYVEPGEEDPETGEIGPEVEKYKYIVDVYAHIKTSSNIYLSTTAF